MRYMTPSCWETTTCTILNKSCGICTILKRNACMISSTRPQSLRADRLHAFNQPWPRLRLIRSLTTTVIEDNGRLRQRNTVILKPAAVTQYERKLPTCKTRDLRPEQPEQELLPREGFCSFRISNVAPSSCTNDG